MVIHNVLSSDDGRDQTKPRDEFGKMTDEIERITLQINRLGYLWESLQTESIRTNSR